MAWQLIGAGCALCEWACAVPIGKRPSAKASIAVSTKRITESSHGGLVLSPWPFATA